MLRKVLQTLGFLTTTSDAATAGEWPSLPTTGFISGRPAQIEDVPNGNAVFVAAVGDEKKIIGRPIPVQIPQYAYLKGKKDRKKPVILVQAEEASNIKLFGVRDFSGKEAVVSEQELELLGSKKPREEGE